MGSIRIDKVNFSPAILSPKTVTVKHRFTSDADTAVNYTTDTTTLSVPVGGVLASPFYIHGLLDNTSYTVRINTDCDSYTQVFVTDGDEVTTTSTSSTTTTTIAPTTTTTTTLPPTTTTTTTEEQLIAYWGWKSDNTVLSDVTIEASINSQVITSTQDITCSFAGGAASPQYLWMAEPLLCDPKTKWQDTVQVVNNGNIGTDQDLFDAPTESVAYRFYITVYQTQQSNSIKFEVI